MDRLRQFVTFALALVFTLGILPAEAQNTPGETYFGVEGGFVQSTLGQGGTSADFRQAPTAGIHFMHNINEALSVQIGVLYVERGGESVVATGDRNVSPAWDITSQEVKLEYADFPILFKLTAPFEPYPGVKFRAVAGPTFSARFDAEIGGEDSNRRLQSNSLVNDRTRFWDLTGVLGGEIVFPVPRVPGAELALNGQYHYGFLNVDTTQSFEYRNRTFTGSLGLRIGLSDL